MLSVREDVEAHVLRKRGWSVSAIARHLGRDRKTVRSYLAGSTTPGARRRGAPDRLAPFGAYVAARFVDDPHLWASALFDEVTALGYDLSYVSFARQLRLAHLRPHCEACSGVKGRATGSMLVISRIQLSSVPGGSQPDDDRKWSPAA